MIRITTKNLPKRTKFHFMFSTEQIRRKMLMLDIFLLASLSIHTLMYFFCRISHFYESFILKYWNSLESCLVARWSPEFEMCSAGFLQTYRKKRKGYSFMKLDSVLADFHQNNNKLVSNLVSSSKAHILFECVLPCLSWLVPFCWKRSLSVSIFNNHFKMKQCVHVLCFSCSAL